MSLATKRILNKRIDVNMTEGSIIKSIIMFAFPLMIGNLFQQFYNIVDTWVVGQTNVNGAFAAVGGVAPILNILIGFFNGLASGTGVVVSQFYGAKNEEKVKKTVHTAMAMTLILGVVFTVVGLLTAPLLLKLMLHGTDGPVYYHAYRYLMIYFSGVLGLMFYNICAAILRAVGDSKRPFYFLIVSSVINIVLDLFFVFVLNMSADGVALATIIAQWVSALLALLALFKTDSVVKINIKNIRLDLKILKRIVFVGIPAGIQMAITSFSNVFVQSYITNVNVDPTIALSGWAAYSKIDMFLFLPTQSIALAVTTFVGQNIGKGNEKRARKGTFIAFALALCVTAVAIIAVLLLSPYIVKIINKDHDVIECGTLLLRYLSPFYILTCVNQIFAAALRGMGNSTAPMIIMLSSFVGFRQLYLFVMSNYISNTLLPIAFGYPAGWAICAITIFTYFIFYRTKKEVVL